LALAPLAATSAMAEPGMTAKTSVIATSNGLRLSEGMRILDIAALRDDIIRVRISHSGALPEDASWAVLPSARSSMARVTPTTSATDIGFSTGQLTVSVSRATWALTMRDKAGAIISADAPDQPIQTLGKGFLLRKQLPERERIFGLGDKTGGFDRRGHAFTLWTTDAYGSNEGTDPHYKSIPFYIGGADARHSYGLLLDNSFRTSFDFGKTQPDVTTLGATDGPIDYYIVYGPSPKQVLTGYAYLTGAAPLPPRWALGFQQSRYSYETAARVKEVASTYRKLNIPADAIYLDIDYQDRNRPLTVNTTTFPDFKGLMTDLKAIGFHAITIVDLHIAAAKDQGYAPYDSGTAGDHFVHRADGSLYVGTVWPGASVFPEFTRAQTRNWFGGLYKNFIDAGVSGIWNDMNEPAIFERLDKTMPPDVMHRINEPGFAPRTATHAEIHNVFGMENSRATFDGLLKLRPDERPFVLTRASYAGGQRYAFTWTGDNQATWDQLRLATPQLLNLGMSGFGFSGVDIGGYAGNATPELLSRWTQIHAFAPMMRYHAEKGSRDKEVWVDGPMHTAIRKHFIEERYRLLPYLYTLAEEEVRTGVPMMRPVFMEFPETMPLGGAAPTDNGNMFMLGSDLLIATPDMGGSLTEYKYDVTLPGGDWYDYWSGKKVATTHFTPHPTLAELPVYVRAGAIIAKQAVIQHDGETPNGPLEVHVYPGPNCAGDVYADDGHSLDYQHGVFVRQHFSCNLTAKKLAVKADAPSGAFKPWWTSIRFVVHATPASPQHLPTGWRYDAEHAILAFDTAAASPGAAATHEVPPVDLQ
jgi:alpha-glucosidase